MLISLSEETQRERSDSIVTPRSKESDEERLTILGVEIPKTFPKVGEFRSSDEVVVEVLHHDRSKFDILVFVSDRIETPEYAPAYFVLF